MSDRIVIVGGGVAAARVSRSYREAGGDGRVTMLSAEASLPYNRPPLSKGLLRGTIEPDAVLVDPAAAYAELEIDFGSKRPWRRSTRAPARSCSPTARSSATTGSCSQPGRPHGGSGFPARRSKASSPTEPSTTRSRVREAARTAGRVLIVGAGFIGMETAASLRSLGLEVTVIEPGERLFAALGHPELSTLARAAVSRPGRRARARRRCHRAPRRAAASPTRRPVRGGASRPGSRSSASASSPRRSTSPAPGSRSTVVPSWSTSTSGRTPPRVFAVGDLASFHDPVAGRRRLIQHWTNAHYQGESRRAHARGRARPVRPGRVLLHRGVRHQARPARRHRGGPRPHRHAREPRGGADRLLPRGRPPRGGVDLGPDARDAGRADAPAARSGPAARAGPPRRGG